MDLERLYRAYKVSRKHNRRSEDMVFFEVDPYVRLYQLDSKVNSRTYAPLHNYSFMHRRSGNPREVYAAEAELKILMAYGLEPLAPYIEAHLSPRTFNNRVGMGAQLAVNTLISDIYEVSAAYTRPIVLFKIDYKGYFPNMLRDYAWRLVYGIIKNEYHGQDKDDIAYCLYIACFCDPRHSRRKSPLWEWNDYPMYKSVYCRPDGVGGFIGYTFWQAVASLYPSVIDGFIAENITRHFVRYVDDTVMVLLAENKEVALSILPELRRRLLDIGITMHPYKFYCQPGEHGVEFLGYRILPGRIHLKKRTITRAMKVARSVDRGKRNFVDAINSYLGMIKATSDIKYAVGLLNSIHRKGIEKDYVNLKIKIA